MVKKFSSVTGQERIEYIYWEHQKKYWQMVKPILQYKKSSRTDFALYFGPIEVILFYLMTKKLETNKG